MSTVQQEIYFRLMFSCVLSSAISTLSLFGFSCIEHIGLTYPWRWITGALWDVVSVGQLIAYSCNCLIVSAITILCYTRMTVTDHVVRKYYQIGTEVFWSNVQIVLLCTGLGGLDTLFTLHVLAPTKYASIFSDTQFFTFNQRSHCLVSCGAFMGFVFSVTLIVFNRLTLLYSHTPTTLLDIISEHTLQRALTTVGRILYFIPLYALCPKPFCGIRHQRLPLVWLILDVRMMLLLFVIGFHLQFSMSCAVSILKWQFSKPIASSVNAIIKSPESAFTTFCKAHTPVEKNLVLERLADLVAIDPSARATVFSLNTLGGRPVLWRQISNWCTTVLDQFLTNVHHANTNVISKNSTVKMPHLELKYQDHLPASFRMQIRQRLGAGSGVSPTHKDIMRSSDADQCSVSVTRQYFGETAEVLYTQILNIASRIPLLRYFKVDVPYAVTAELFAKPFEDATAPSLSFASGQALIWAVEILACLTLASYTEDTFGSVQRSLGRILTLFVDGLEAVERHLRLAGLLTREMGPDNHPFSQDGFANGNGVWDDAEFSDLTETPRPVSHMNPILYKTEDICNLSYYRFASDPTLPWRVYATLTWAATNCLRQFGEHLESIQMSQKARQRLRSVMATRVGAANLNGSVQMH